MCSDSNLSVSTKTANLRKLSSMPMLPNYTSLKVEKNMPLLLHGYVGARLIEEEYGIADGEISQAIYRHTVGGADMTDLDKIIYFADMIEPGRRYPGVDELRSLAKTATLDEMVLAGLTRSIEFVLEKGHLIHPDTVIARNEILIKVHVNI